MEKYKVLLIDDEPVIIEGLKIVIDWEELNCEIAGCATDGETGLSQIKALKPDIVISDIRMPNSTGIEMIKNALSACPCKFIVLSGYSDFSYARQCISLGVQEYLLKPVEEDLLIEAVKKVQQQIEEEKLNQNTLTRLEANNQYLSLLNKDYMLRELVNSYFENSQDLFSTLNSYEIEVPKGSSYICIALQPAGYTGPISELREVLSSILSDLFQDSLLLFLYNETCFMAIIALSEKTTEDILNDRLSSLKKKLNNDSHLQLSIGVGNTYPDPLKISVSAKQALYALSFKIIRGENSINPFSSSLKSAHFIMSVPDGLWDNYHESIKQLDFKNISAAIKKIYDYIRDFSDMPLPGIQITSINILLICIQQLNETDTFCTVDISEMDCFTQISSFCTLDETALYTENLVYNLIRSVKTTSPKKTSGVIIQIENYLHDHVYEDLSLISVARLFYLSPIYLSQLFKKETGQLYIDYVTDLKINTAKRLLLSSDSKIYEISDKLGYKDSKYFSRLFEKKTGLKPSEFRKKVF